MNSPGAWRTLSFEPKGKPMMGGYPTVTIIVPFLNVESFLSEAVESVLAQTFTEWELLLVDDGSTDRSTEIARSYAARFGTRIRYVEHDGHANRGASAARNLGRQRARGRYIAYLDADDVWLPSKLEQQVRILETWPTAGMVIGATRYWYSWTGRDEHQAQDKVVLVGAPQDRLIEPPLLLRWLYPLGTGAAPSVNTILIRTHLLDRLGGWEDKFRVAYEDQAFLTKVYTSAPVFVSSCCCDLYRQKRANSNTANELVGKRWHAHRQRYLEWLEEYLRRRGMVGSTEWQLARRAMRPYRFPLLRQVERAGRWGARHVIKGLTSVRP